VWQKEREAYNVHTGQFEVSWEKTTSLRSWNEEKDDEADAKGEVFV
jgi:hypothetical protein